MTWTLHHGSCLDAITGLASLADKSVDVTITDPPYDAKTDAGHVRRGGKERVASIGVGALSVVNIDEIARELCRVTRRWVLAFCADEQLEKWQDAFRTHGRIVRDGWWRKSDASPQFTGDRPAVPGEHVVIAYGTAVGRMRWNGGGRHAFWTTGTCKGAERGEHPTQKPLDLMSMLVADFSDPGELVLDPFAGSGSTGVACSQLGRNFVGWELDAEYHAIATRRLSGERGIVSPIQGDMFTAVR